MNAELQTCDIMKIGEFVLLLSNDESYLVKISNSDFHMKSGFIKSSDLKKVKIGYIVKTHLGKGFSVVRPNIVDILKKGMKRMPQVILPKDIALIIAYTGVSPGNLVVDVGCGSGYTTIFLANYIRPGKVVAYENNKKILKVAKKNIELSGLSKFIKIRNKDATKGIFERNADLVTVDIQNPEKVIKHAYKTLRPGGYLVIYSPIVEELIKVSKEIKKKDFCGVKTVENIVREWQTERTTRPKTMGLMHTGFLTFARKVE